MKSNLNLDTEFKFQFFFLILAALFKSMPLAVVPFLGYFVCLWGVAKRVRSGTVGLLIQALGFFVYFSFWFFGFAHFFTLVFVGPVVIFITAFRYTLKHRDAYRVFD